MDESIMVQTHKFVDFISVYKTTLYFKLENLQILTLLVINLYLCCYFYKMNSKYNST